MTSTINSYIDALYTNSFVSLRRLLRKLVAEQPALKGVDPDPAKLRDLWGSEADNMLKAFIVTANSSASDRDRSAAVAGILVALRPGMTGLQRRLSHRPNITPDDIIAEVAYGIVTYRSDRRPQRIAANLLLDALQRLTVRGIHRHDYRHTSNPSPTDRLADPNVERRYAQIDLDLTIKQSWPCPPGRTPDHHHHRLRMLTRVAAGESVIDIATSDGLPPGTGWRRMHDTRREIRTAHTRTWLQAA